MENYKSNPSVGILSAKIETVADGEIYGIPIYKKKIIGMDTMPDGNDILIVSALYASAVAMLHPEAINRIYTIADPIYTPDGKTVVGCRGICPIF